MLNKLKNVCNKNKTNATFWKTTNVFGADPLKVPHNLILKNKQEEKQL